MRNRTLFVCLALVMLVFISMLILPLSERKHIPKGTAFALAGLLWAASVFAVWACLRSRRRRHSDTHNKSTTIGTDYSELDDQESLSQRHGGSGLAE